MESGAGARNVQEESVTLVAGIQKTLGFATTSGQDYEVALCSLIFLRALRFTRDFFLVSNHAQTGKFDDVVLFYRLKGDQGHKYRAFLLQAKHRDNFTQKKLTSSNPFRVKEYLESFREVKRLLEQPVNVHCRLIEVQEFSLILYTNTGCVIGEAAVDVTNIPELKHLEDFVNTRGRLLRISKAQQLGLPEGKETSDFLAHLLLCTEQMSVDMSNRILEEELSNLLKLKSPDVARNLNSKLKSVMKAWWGERTVRCLTAESDEWYKVLEIEITRLNGETLNIDSKLNLDFTEVALDEFKAVLRHLKKSWVSVEDEYHANAIRSRLFRAQRNSLIVSVKSLVDHFGEVEALWTNYICPILVLDMSTVSTEDGPLMLERLQEALQSDTGRHSVIIAKGKPTTPGWSEVDAVPTWSVLHRVTRDRMLATPVRLQEKTVALRDVVGSHVSDVMTEDVINSVCECETEMKLGAMMPAPLEYNLPRCLQRTSSRGINLDSLQNTNVLIFLSNYLLQENEFTKRFKIINKYEADRITVIKCSTIVTGISNDYDIRQLCFRFRVQGIYALISMGGLQGDVTEFIPFTWTCEEKIVVIEGPAGVGKTSFVTAMCSTVKEQFPEAWVLRLEMGRYTDYIKENEFTEVRQIIELLLKGLHKDPNILERRLLEHSLIVTGNVFLFLDAFDEISPDFTIKCCDLLKGINQSMKFRQMVVTTRPVTTKEVEEALQTKAFTLPVFSEEEQGLFLKQFSAAKGNYISEEEISYLRQSAGLVLEIPLLCRMAAEVFLYRREQLFLKCQNPWRRVLLYKLFVEQIVINRHAEKFGMEVSIPGIKKLLDYSSKLHLQNLQGLAVRKLMSIEQIPPLTVSTETPEEKLGLVVNSGGRVDFEHQTFAEYFLGCWLARHWQQCPRQLLRDVLFQDGFEFVAATFNWLLFDGFPLHMAVAQGDEDAVRKHLSPWTTDRGGRSALHVAAITQGENCKVWELLMTSGEDLNKKDGVLEITAGKYAEMFSNWEFIELVLEKGVNIADLNFVTVQDAATEVLLIAVKKDLVFLCQYIWRRHSNIFQNLPLLHIAAANNSKHVLKLLIETLQNIDEINESRFTPLQVASRQGHVEAVTMLVDSGADVNMKTEYGYGYTAVAWAARKGHLDVVQTLIEKGADLNIQTTGGNTALTWAARRGHLDIVKILLEKGGDLNIKTSGGNTALIWAAREGHLEVVKILLEKGGDLNIKTACGDTALIWVAREGHLETMKMILEKGGDLNIKTENGYTALTWAARGGHWEAVKVLLEKGADINIKTDYADTALTLAAARGHLEVVKIILERGGDLNIKTENGYTALTEAARGGHLEVVKVLLENRADINIKTDYGDTALTLAAVRGNLELVNILLEKGADVNIKAEDGDTALTLAAGGGYLDAVKVLMENGADVSLENVKGESALVLADKGRHLEVWKFLSGLKET